jgi:UDP-N-acetyl-2-amino-2-deoxyglucuronate dehydrogenase
MHIGIIGGGNSSETHARAAKAISGVEIAAIYGHNREKTARLSDLYGGRVYDDLHSMLRHKPLEMVLIGSPSGLHAEHGIAAAKQNLHVLVEKPIDVTTTRATELIDTCERAGVKLGVCFQDRFSPQIGDLKRLLETGALGKPILVSGQVKWYRPPEYYAGSRWRGTLELDGGGALINQGVHTIDLLLWLMGDVTRIHAMARTALHNIAAEDTLVATFEFANGAVGTFEATTAAYPGYSRRVELTGSEGTLILEDDRITACDLRSDGELLSSAVADKSSQSTSAVLADSSGHQRVLEDFLHAIETGGRPRCDGQEGRRSIELVEAIYESARTGEPVMVGSHN